MTETSSFVFMDTTSYPEVMTVGQLRELISRLPDDHEVWTFDERNSTFAPAVWAMADKRNRSVNISFQPNG